MSYENSSLVTCKFIKIIFLKHNKNLKNAVHISFKNIYNTLCKHKDKRGLTTTKKEIKDFTKVFQQKITLKTPPSYLELLWERLGGLFIIPLLLESLGRNEVQGPHPQEWAYRVAGKASDRRKRAWQHPYCEVK